MLRKMISKAAAFLGLVTAVLSILLLSGCGTTTVDLEDLLSVSYSGVNGYGKIEKAGFSREKMGMLDTAVQDFILSRVTVLPYSNSSLSNGDEIRFMVNYQESALEKAGEANHFTIKQESGALLTRKVEGLPEAEPFDPFENLVMNCQGYNGFGRISFSSEYLPAGATFSYRQDRQGSFSNGDTVEVTVYEYFQGGYENDCLAQLGKRPTRTKATFTVSGLSEPKKMDLFQNISVSLDGADGYARATVEGPYEDLTYKLDRDYGIATGDTLHVTVEYRYGDVAAWCMDKYEAVPETLTYDYTVGDLPEYITKYSDIPESLMNQMRMKVERTKDTLLQKGGDSSRLDFISVNYVGSYFLVSKSMSGEVLNRLFLVYAVEASADKQPSRSYYHVVSFKNLMCYDDETGSVDVNDFEAYGSEVDLGAWTFMHPYGYSILSDFTSECIDSQRTNFNVETTVKEEELPF